MIRARWTPKNVAKMKSKFPLKVHLKTSTSEKLEFHTVSMPAATTDLDYRKAVLTSKIYWMKIKNRLQSIFFSNMCLKRCHLVSSFQLYVVTILNSDLVAWDRIYINYLHERFFNYKKQQVLNGFRFWLYWVFFSFQSEIPLKHRNVYCKVTFAFKLAYLILLQVLQCGI